MLTGRRPSPQHLALGASDKWTAIKVQSLAPLAGIITQLLDGAPLLTLAGESMVVFQE